MSRLKEDIELSLSKSKCRLHAYVIMTNHIHLLLTPKNKEQLTKFMQSMANRYVRYFNAKYQQTGSIWEGRFKSCLVDSDHYLFALYKYIEMNPIKANMVKDIADYKWSSYRYNALGHADNLISEHKLYTALGASTEQRCDHYQQLFDKLNITEQQSKITQATMRGEVYGSDEFHARTRKRISRPTKLTSHGGDRKSSLYKDQAG